MLNMGDKRVGLNATPKTIINKWSAGGVAALALTTNEAFAGIKATLSGELTAAAYKEMLSLTGPGVVDYAAVCNADDTTSRTIGIKVILDGATVFDAISAAITARSEGIVAIGLATIAGNVQPWLPVPFSSSCVISIKSSLSETDKIYFLCGYRTT